MIDSSDGRKLIYLNNAATSFPKPKCVAKAVANEIESISIGDHRGSFDERSVNDELRDELATLLHVDDSQRIALGPNATWGLNEAIFGLDLKAGDCIVTTMAEHNSVLRPLFVLETRGIDVVYVEVMPDGRVNENAWRDAIANRHPKAAIATHASNVTGAVNDIASLMQFAKSHGAITIVDASQTLGAIELDASDPNIDIVAFTGHKYLLGPQGTGGVYVSEGVDISPHTVGGTGAMSDLREMPDEYPLHLEAGTGNTHSNAGLLAAIRWAKNNPLDHGELEAKTSNLRSRLAEAGAHVIDVASPSTPVVAFTIDGLEPGYVGDLLLDCYDIICRTGLHCAPRIVGCLGEGFESGTIRVSVSRFTTDEEIDALIEGIEDIVSSELE